MDSKQTKTQNKFLHAYDKYSDEIFRFCMLKVRNRENATDIVQDAFIKTWEYLERGNEIKQIRPFLYRTAYNLIVDHSRKKSTLSIEDTVNLDTDLGHEDDLTKTVDSIDGKLAIELLDGLTDQYRLIIEMKYLQGLTLSEIAYATKKKKETISVQIHRAEKVLKDLYKAKYEENI